MTKPPALICPTVHLNGTSRKELQANYRTAYEALERALDAMKAIAPHGRDYYPQDSKPVHGPVYLAARDQHDARVAAVAQVQRDILALHKSTREPADLDTFE